MPGMAAGVTSHAIGNHGRQAAVEIDMDASFALALRDYTKLTCM